MKVEFMFGKQFMFGERGGERRLCASHLIDS